MNSNNNFDFYEQLQDLDELPVIRNMPNGYTRKYSPDKKPRQKEQQVDIAEISNEENSLDFTYSASKHEKEWLISSLQDFYYQQWFDDILRLIKGGGKEASVYQCLGNNTTPGAYLAAKVYRPRKFRQLRNDSLYREGRLNLDDEGHEVRDDRALHAIHKRTNYGKRLMHTSWIGHEFQTMKILFEAGVEIPQPFTCGNNAILMAYIGWDDIPAPTLNDVDLPATKAREIFERTIQNVELMLKNHRVHGDLSAYNILYHEGNIYLIDFPQAIDPDVNRNAYAIFCRDLQRLCEYFQTQGVRCDAQNLAKDMWLKQGYRVRPPVDPHLIDPDYLEEL